MFFCKVVAVSILIAATASAPAAQDRWEPREFPRCHGRDCLEPKHEPKCSLVCPPTHRFVPPCGCAKDREPAPPEDAKRPSR